MANTIRAKAKKYTREQVLAIAAKASADPRTVEKFAKGEPVRGAVGERIAAAARGVGK